MHLMVVGGANVFVFTLTPFLIGQDFGEDIGDFSFGFGFGHDGHPFMAKEEGFADVRIDGDGKALANGMLDVGFPFVDGQVLEAEADKVGVYVEDEGGVERFVGIGGQHDIVVGLELQGFEEGLGGVFLAIDFELFGFRAELCVEDGFEFFEPPSGIFFDRVGRRFDHLFKLFDHFGGVAGFGRLGEAAVFLEGHDAVLLGDEEDIVAIAPLLEVGIPLPKDVMASAADERVADGEGLREIHFAASESKDFGFNERGRSIAPAGASLLIDHGKSWILFVDGEFVILQLPATFRWSSFLRESGRQAARGDQEEDCEHAHG